MKDKVISAHNQFIDSEVQQAQEHINIRKIKFEDEMKQFCQKLDMPFNDHIQFMADYRLTDSTQVSSFI